MDHESQIGRLLAAARDNPLLEERLLWGSFVCARHRLFYMDTLKCACTTIKWLIAHVEGFQPAPRWMDGEARLETCIHNRAFHPLPSLLRVDEKTAEQALYSGDYLRFCVVRNPYWRLVSSWMSKIRDADPLFGWANAEIRRRQGREKDDRPCGFREFADWVVATNDPQSCNVHWRPQEILLLPAFITYDVTLRTEALGEQLAALFNRVESLRAFDARELLRKYNYNESLPLVDEPLYDEDLAARVYEFYKKDFETYNYARDSWKEPRLGKASASSVEAAALSQIRRRNQLIRLAWSELSEQTDRRKAAALEADRLGEECESLRGILGAEKKEIDNLRRELAAEKSEAQRLRNKLAAAQPRIDHNPLVVQRVAKTWRRLETSIRRRFGL